MVVLIRSKAMYPCPPHMGKHSWSHKQGGPVPSELRSRLPQPAWAELLGTIQGQHGNQALANYMMRANLLAACFGVLIIVVMSIVYAPLILPFLIVEAVIWAVMVRRADKRLHPHRCAALANELSPSYESQYGVSIRWDASQNGFRVESTVAGGCDATCAAAAARRTGWPRARGAGRAARRRSRRPAHHRRAGRQAARHHRA